MEQTLELKMKSQAEDAIKKINELSKTVSSLGDSVKKVTSTLTSSAKTTNTTITSTRKEGDKLYTTIRKIGSDGSLKKTTVSVKELEGATTGARSNFSKLADTISKLGKGLSLAGLYVGVKNMASKFVDWMDLAVDRIEQLNLFNVVFKNITKDGQEAFSTLGKEAINFQYKLKEAFGTNLTDTLQHQALFQSMAENQGIGDTYAKLMSENMTKMVYDLGSLYNRSEEDVAAALKAGVYAGQTKPLRAFGLDITSTSLQPLLDSLGINDRSIAELSQAEKQILRYIAVLKQAQVAMGDYANNIESPAIQTKVFKNTLIEAKVALQSLFIQTFAKILPYANAILMVITEVTKAIASFFGIKLQDYNSGIASNLGDIDDGIDSVGDSAGSATGKVKELKRQLLGFDQINNINDPKNSGSSGGSGGGTSGGIDQRLLDALYGYDNGMDKIRMKATEIRDKIMEWLGFMKVIDPITGEVSFKFANTQSTIYKLVMAFKDIVKYGKQAIKGVFEVIKKDFDSGTFGKILVGVFETIANMLKFIAQHKQAQKIIAKLVEAFLLFKTVTIILKPFVTLFNKFTGLLTAGVTNVRNFAKTLKGTNNYIKDAKGNLKEYNDEVKGHNVIIDEATGKTDKWATFLSKSQTAIGGLVSAASGLFILKSSVDDATKSGWDLSNALGVVAGSLTTIGGLAAAGSIFGPIGTAVGALVGTLLSLGTATLSWKSETEIAINEVTESLKNYKDEMKDLKKAREESISGITYEYDYYSKLFEELKQITDENGKIKQGYEERAQVITTVLSDALGIEIQIVDGVIQKYGDLENSIYDVINAKKAEATLNAYEAEYNKAIQKKTELQKIYKDSVKNTKQAQDEYNKTLEALAKQYGTTTEEINSYINGEKDFYDLTMKARSAVNSFYEKMDETGISLNKATSNLEKANKAQKDAGKELDNNQVIIDNYNTAIELMAGKHYEAVLKMYDNTVTFNGKTKQENDKKYKEESEAIDIHLKELKSRKDQYSDEEYKSLVKGYQLQKEALKQAHDEANQALDEKQKIAKEKLIKNLNSQLKVIQDKKIEWKDAGKGNAQMYVDGIATGEPVSKETAKKLTNGAIDMIKSKKMSAKEAGEYLIDGVNLGIGNSYKQKNVYSTIGSFTNNIINLFKSKLNIHSPSKTTETFGRQLLEGFNIGIDEEKNNVLQNISSFTSDIIDNMNTDLGRFDLDFNSQLSGLGNKNINTTSTIGVADNMANKISYQLANAINNQSITVRLDAHTDEGVIIDRINQKTSTTGVCPINIPF